MNLADIITFQGRSIDEMKQALADSVEDYLEFRVDEGKAPEKPYSGRFNARLNPEARQRAAMEAAGNGVSLNSWPAEMLYESVDHHL
jgi:predicted HicB family RNase H-like nuclease